MTLATKIKEINNLSDNYYELFEEDNTKVLQFWPDFGVMEEWIFNADTEEAIEGFCYIANMPHPTPPIQIYP